MNEVTIPYTLFRYSVIKHWESYIPLNDVLLCYYLKPRAKEELIRRSKYRVLVSG